MENSNTASAETPEIEKANKGTRVRSAKYPSNNIESTKEFVEKIDKEFSSNVFTPQLAISETLNVSGGGFLMNLSTAVQYGLLESSYGEGYRPSPLFKKIQKPLPTENVNEFLLESLNMPPLYKKLLAEFKNKQLPSERGLSNILDRIYNIKGNASSVAAKVFLKNLSLLGLIIDGNVLSLDSYIPFVEEKNDDTKHEDKHKPNALIIALPEPKVVPPKKINEHSDQQREIPIMLDDGSQATVHLPKFNTENLKRVIKILGGYID